MGHGRNIPRKENTMINARPVLPAHLRSAVDLTPDVRARSVESAIRRIYGRTARPGASPNRVGESAYTVMVVRDDSHGSHVVGTMYYTTLGR